jgi:hypothetical protein
MLYVQYAAAALQKSMSFPEVDLRGTLFPTSQKS